MKSEVTTSTTLYLDMKYIMEQKTNCLFEYLRQVQDLNARMRQLQLSDEIMSILRQHDEKLREILLRDAK